MRTWGAAVVAFGLFGATIATAADKPAAAAAAPAKTTTAAKTGTSKGGAAKGAKTKKAPASAEKPAAETVSGPEVRNFRAFCDEWMQKLRDRETYNTAHIAWETSGGRVSGDYLGYDTNCTCVAREEPGKDPIGKITYRETKYRRAGATQAEALASQATIVEQSDVTEIFRYAKGRWQY
jgi:hypothetical protein